MNKKDLAKEIINRLKPLYPDPGSALNWRTPYELLVSTVLAAQCTDARVNTVTPEFFRRWPDAAHLAQAKEAEIEEVIRSTGFFRQKAKNLLASAKIMLEKFAAEPPRTMAELTSLPGVARKTANIVLSNAYNVHEGIAVDTHVRRVSGRLGLTESNDPKRIEKDLMPLFDRQDWGLLNHLLVLFGRATCKARKPDCPNCPLLDICPRIGVDK